MCDTDRAKLGRTLFNATRPRKTAVKPAKFANFTGPHSSNLINGRTTIERPTAFMRNSADIADFG